MGLSGEAEELRQVCDRQECPVCTLTARVMDRYFDHLLYNKVNSIYARADIRTAWGFCNRHAHMLIEPHGGSVGVAIIYQDVLKNLLRALDGGKWQSGWRKSGGDRLAGALVPQQPCPGCVQQASTETQYAKAVALSITDAAFREAFEASGGLCWRHLQLALRLVQDREAFEALVAVQRNIWARLEGELAEFIRKNDYRFQHEAMGEEGDSWKRVVSRLAGKPGLGGQEKREVG